MSLPRLIRADAVKNTNKIIPLTYENDLSSDVQSRLTSDSKKSSDVLLVAARKKADEIIYDATLKAESLQQTLRSTLQREREQAESDIATLRDRMLQDVEDERTATKNNVEQSYKELEQQKEETMQLLEASRGTIRQEAYTQTYDEAKNQAFEDTKEETKRLVGRVQAILDEAVRRRREMITGVEYEISDLVMLIARKVVKVISDSDRGVVVQNVIHALRSLKGREHFVIRVNTKDLGQVKQYMPTIQKELEINGNITFAEDTKVDPGGCVIETELGEVDARISTQLAEIERKIREAIPIQNVKF